MRKELQLRSATKSKPVYRSEETLSASAGVLLPVKRSIIKPVPSRIKTKQAYNCGDVIVLKTGKEIKCKVLSISETALNYKDCKSQNISLKTLPLSSVKYIRYKNGVVENFGNTTDGKSEVAEVMPLKKDHLKGEKFAIGGYICAFITGLITLLVVPVAGLIIMLISAAAILLIGFNENYDDPIGIKILIVIGDLIAGAYIFALAIALIAAVAAF